MAIFTDLLGTSLDFFRIGLNGIRLKLSSGKLVVRNSADTADAQVDASRFAASGTAIDLNTASSSSGGNFPYTVSAPTTGMSAAVNLRLPPTLGSPGQVLGTDGSITSWVSAASTASCLSVDTTTLNFNSAATVAMFSLPANAQVLKVRFIITTAFNTAATASVGVAGATSEFMGANQLALNSVAGDIYEVNPTVAASGSAKSLIITYAAAGATAGSAQVLVYYSIPA